MDFAQTTAFNISQPKRAMFEERNLKLDLLALGLVALVVFLGLSLVTYNPADSVGAMVWPINVVYQQDAVVYPPSENISNLCGRLGALASDVMLTGLGIGAYYLLLSAIILNVLLLMRREITTPVIRFFGWFGSLAGLTTLSAVLMPNVSPGPVIGPGGYLGALGRGILETQFALVGSVILAVSVMLGGLMLCTDYTLLEIAAFLSRNTLGRISLRRRAGETDEEEEEEGYEEGEEEEEEDEAEGQALKIRVSGRKIVDEEEETEEEDEELEDEADDEEEEEECDEAEEEEDEEEKTSVLAAVKKRLKPKLKVKKPKKASEREEMMEQIEAASQTTDTADYELPKIDLLLPSDDVSFDAQEKEVRQKAKALEKAFDSFGFNVKVVEIETGPVIAQYEVELEKGLRLSKIVGLADDVAIALRVPSVRIVAPIPGKNTVGIEVPNNVRQIVRLREVMEEADGRVSKMKVPLFLGKDVSGKPMTVDLASLPHLLIAGRTGTGKSVCLNTIISSILMTRRPDEVRMLMIDPKMVELSCYRTLPHLMHPVVTDMKKAEAILAWAVEKMEERYSLLSKVGVRHVSVYNQLGEEELMDRLGIEADDEEAKKSVPLHLPYIVIVADEIADLMMTAGKEVEQHIIRLAQKSRAVGIHLILATQKPTVDVITGLIKSNLPARLAFQVASRTDSRVVLDEMGADKLLGNGDMLFLWPGTSTLMRGQGTFLSDDEINTIVECASRGEQNFVHELVNLKVEDGEESETPGKLKNRDELYESAIEVVVREGRGSVSLLQRSLGIGYGRAARLIDFMEEDGIVGQYAGSQAREVLIDAAKWAQMQGLDVDEDDDDDDPDPTPPRRNKIVPSSDWDDEESTAKDESSGSSDDAEEVAEYDDEEYEEEEDEEEQYEEEEEEEEDEEEYEDEVASDEDEEEEEEYEEDEYEEDEEEYEEYDEDEEDEQEYKESA